jgi:hypothetical protein
LIAVVPGGQPSELLNRLSADRFGELALMTASVGNYNEQQTLLDITQGNRVPRINYSPQAPPPLKPLRDGSLGDWPSIAHRARSAEADIEPGLLAASVPGGAGYVGSSLNPGADAVLAAGRNGQLAAVSLGSPASLLVRIESMMAKHRLVVADLGDGAEPLRVLLRTRARGELLLVLERPPATAPAQTEPPKLLALAAAGLGARAGALASATTRTDGLVTPSDLGPTILDWLGLRGPSQFSGQRIILGRPRSLTWFASFARRVAVIQSRRTSALLVFLGVWALGLAVAFVSRKDLRAVLRVGGLAALWAPLFALLTAALEPSAALELSIIAVGAFAAATANDRLLPWPRAPAVPVALVLALFTLDLARGSHLIDTSLIGSDPISGARFFGAGNELAALLPVALFAGLAAALPQRAVRSREVAMFGAAALLATLILAWGRLGANVGAIFTIGGGGAFAIALLIPGRLGVRRLGLVAIAVVASLALVAVLDLATGGGAHFTREVLHAHSLTALLDTLRRRLFEAWSALFAGFVGPAVLVCLAFAAVAIAQRRRLLAPVGEANAWPAALAGGFAGAVLGSIADDSGPRVLLVGCAMLACVLAYLQGAPEHSGTTPSYPVLNGASKTENSGPASPGRTRPFWASATIWR